MRKVILSMMVSLDGSIARSDGDIGWFLTDTRFEEMMFELLRSVDAMMFGRVSYELLAQYWPTAGAPESQDAPGGFTSDERRIEFARLMNSIPKIVFSRTISDPAWGPVRVVSENIAEEVSRMKGEPGRDLVLFAGAELGAVFMNLDLVDEYRLMVHPVVLAQGIGLFAKVEAERPLRLLGAEALPCGVVLLRYERGSQPQ